MMNMLQCIESREEKNLSSLPVFYGKFLLSDLQKGQGLTVANTLRRILYSELSAVGITSVKIKNHFPSSVELTSEHGQKSHQRDFHEFSTFPFLKESLGELIFNLRSILFKTSVPSISPQIGVLNFDLNKINEIQQILRAKNLTLPPDIELVFPDQYIGTLIQPGKVDFSLECTIEKILNSGSVQTGIDQSTQILLNAFPESEKKINSMSKEQPKLAFTDNLNTKQLNPLHENILQDRRIFSVHKSIFPVKKVNYTVESDSFEKELVFFEIWTNGTLSPEKALADGVLKSIELFQKFHA